jgi:hypothetical protein
VQPSWQLHKQSAAWKGQQRITKCIASNMPTAGRVMLWQRMTLEALTQASCFHCVVWSRAKKFVCLPPMLQARLASANVAEQRRVWGMDYRQHVLETFQLARHNQQQRQALHVGVLRRQAKAMTSASAPAGDLAAGDFTAGDSAAAASTAAASEPAAAGASAASALLTVHTPASEGSSMYTIVGEAAVLEAPPVHTTTAAVAAASGPLRWANQVKRAADGSWQPVAQPKSKADGALGVLLQHQVRLAKTERAPPAWADL